MLFEYLSGHVQLCAIYRSHVRRHHPQPQLPTRPPPARILPPERQGQESHPGQSLPLACRLLRGEFDQAADLSLAPQLGPVFGLLFVLQRMAEGLGIAAVLGHSRLAKLGLFLVLARVAHQGCRRCAGPKTRPWVKCWVWGSSTKTICMPLWMIWPRGRSGWRRRCIAVIGLVAANRPGCFSTT